MRSVSVDPYRIPDPDHHQNLIIICSLAHCQPSLKILCKSAWKFFYAKLLTDKQTNNDDYITSLAEVINRLEKASLEVSPTTAAVVTYLQFPILHVAGTGSPVSLFHFHRLFVC